MPVTVSKPAFNLREALSSLKRRVGIKGSQLLGANTTAEAYAAINPVMFRNKLINGGFDVAQRGVSFTDPGSYTLDRWASQSNPTNTVITQQAFAQNTNVIPGNPKNYFRITFNNSATQAADRVVLMQRVEDYQQFVGRTVVLSGWYRSTVTLGGCNWLFQMKRSSGFYDNCSEQADPRGFEIPSSDWQYFERRVLVSKSVLVGQTMTSSASFGITLYYQTCNNTGYMDFANLQLELDQATPFEQRPYATELALCQRYYWQTLSRLGGGYAFDQIGQGFIRSLTTTGAPVTIQVPYPVPMRSSPSIGTTNGVNFTCQVADTAHFANGGLGVWASGNRIGWVDLNVDSTSGWSVGNAVSVYCRDGASDMFFSAEL